MSDDSVLVKIGSSAIANSIEKTLLGVTLDSKLTFEQHSYNNCHTDLGQGSLDAQLHSQFNVELKFQF